MKDRIFFPLALLLAAGMVLLAVWPGFGRLPDGPVTGDGANYDRITVEGGRSTFTLKYKTTVARAFGCGFPPSSAA